MDKVRLKAQERLDLVDANALQDLVYGYLSKAIGGLMGNAGGALSTIEYSVSEAGGVYTLTLGAFQYYHSQPAVITSVTESDGAVRSVPKHFVGQVVSFDPADEGQSATVDWSASRNVWVNSASSADHPLAADSAKRAVHGGHKPGGSMHMPLLWARPFTQDGATDARREWSVSSQSEVAVSMATRTRTRTELRFSTARPVVLGTDTNQNQWVAIARTVAWDFSSGTVGSAGQIIPDAPYLAPLYVWDHTSAYGGYEQQNGIDVGGPQGRVGLGAARFSMDDGAKSAAHAPHANLTGSTTLESAPFEGDGATISNIARGDWLPGSKVGEPGIAGTGTAAAGASPWPYPGWYDDVAGSWKTLKSSGLNTDVPLWRLGIPHVMHLMRRVLSTILSSKGNRPWYAYPEGGGLAELRAEIDQLRVDVNAAAAASASTGQASGGGLSVLAAGRVFGDVGDWNSSTNLDHPEYGGSDDPGSVSAAVEYQGFGLVQTDSGKYGRTSTGNGASFSSGSMGAHWVTYKLVNADGSDTTTARITAVLLGEISAYDHTTGSDHPGSPQGMGVIPAAAPVWGERSLQRHIITRGDKNAEYKNSRITIWVYARGVGDITDSAARHAAEPLKPSTHYGIAGARFATYVTVLGTPDDGFSVQPPISTAGVI